MEFNEAFEKLTLMAAGRRCKLEYGRYSCPEFGVYANIYCIILRGDEGSFITTSHKTFEGTLAEMAELLAGRKEGKNEKATD